MFGSADIYNMFGFFYIMIMYIGTQCRIIRIINEQVHYRNIARSFLEMHVPKLYIFSNAYNSYYFISTLQIISSYSDRYVYHYFNERFSM